MKLTQSVHLTEAFNLIVCMLCYCHNKEDIFLTKNDTLAVKKILFVPFGTFTQIQVTVRLLVTGF